MSYTLSDRLFQDLTKNEANQLIELVKLGHLKGKVDMKHPAWLEYVKL